MPLSAQAAASKMLEIGERESYSSYVVCYVVENSAKQRRALKTAQAQVMRFCNYYIVLITPAE